MGNLWIVLSRAVASPALGLKKITLAAEWRIGAREGKGEAARRHLQSVR